MIEHTYINPEHNDHSNTNKDIYGLGFKSRDNSVNLKTPEINLGLNDFTVEIWARTEGSDEYNQPVFGSNKGGYYLPSVIKIYANSSVSVNGIRSINMERPTVGDAASNSIFNVFNDSTKNLHHIVITRQGTLVTATINGRLIKSVTQDRVLDFSKFVFDIANTTYFSIGRVFNYCMSADEVQMLWNGGRVDEVVLPNYLLGQNSVVENIDISRLSREGQKITVIDNEVSLEIESIGTGFYGLQSYHIDRIGEYVLVEFEAKSTNIGGVGMTKWYLSDYYSVIDQINPKLTSEFQKYRAFLKSKNLNNNSLFIVFGYSGASDMLGKKITMRNIKVTNVSCLLELLPSSIHPKGIYNTGTLGSSHDAVLSKPNETIFHRERPYKDKQMSTGAPNFHPIAMGQECYNTVNGDIYRASIPPVGREWSVADWKQINII